MKEKLSEIYWELLELFNTSIDQIQMAHPVYEFAKETLEKNYSVISSLQKEINKMKLTVMKIDSGTFMIKPDMKLMIVDGKIYQALSGTLLLMTCYICQATPKEMNDLDRVNIT